MGGTVFSVDRSIHIWVGLKKQYNEIHQHTNAKQPYSKQIEDPHPYFPLVEFVRADGPQKQAQQNRHPLVLGPAVSSVPADILIYVRICIGIVDHHAGLGTLPFDRFHLAAAHRTNNGVLRDLRAAMLAEFCLCHFLRFLLHHTIPHSDIGNDNLTHKCSFVNICIHSWQ